MRILRIALAFIKVALGVGVVGALVGVPVALAAKTPPAPPVQVEIFTSGGWPALDAPQAADNLALLLAGAKPVAAEPQPGLTQARFRRASQEYWVVWSAAAQPVLVSGLEGRRAWLYPLDAAALAAGGGEELLVSSDGQAVLPLESAPLLLVTEPSSPVERFRLQALWQGETWLDARKGQVLVWFRQQSASGSELLEQWGRELKGLFFNWAVEKLREIFA